MKRILVVFVSLIASVSFAATPQKLTVMLDWSPNPNHTPLIVAAQQGYFREQGLDVVLVSPNDPKQTMASVAAHKVDIGITWQPEYMQQVDAGAPLISIGTLIDKPLTSLVALKGNNIQDITDFRGKRIGASGGGLSEVMLKAMLTQSGVNADDVKITNVSHDPMQALVSHQVDVIADIRRNVEVPMIEAGDKKVVTFFPEDHGVPTYSELVFIINTKNIHDTRYPRFLAAVKKAVRYMDESPKLAWQKYIKQYPRSNNNANRDAMFATIPYFAEDPAYVDGNEWQQFAEFMQENKLIKKVQPVERYAVILR